MPMSVRLLHWMPRVLCIAAILFVSMFALDSTRLVELAVHLIPTAVLLGVLVIAWRWPLPGGLLFTLLGLALTPAVFQMNYRRIHSVGMSLVIVLTITIPFVVVGLLFVADHYVRRRAA